MVEEPGEKVGQVDRNGTPNQALPSDGKLSGSVQLSLRDEFPLATASKRERWKPSTPSIGRKQKVSHTNIGAFVEHH